MQLAGVLEQLFLKMCDHVAITSSGKEKALRSTRVSAMTALLKELMMQRYRMPSPGHQAGWAVVMTAVCGHMVLNNVEFKTFFK